MPQSLKTENINNNFFSGNYKEIWKQIFPEKTTLAEVNYIIEEAGLSEGSQVLDIMCGYGRHALELAKRGFSVTAVDNLQDYIEEINNTAAKQNLVVETICIDVLNLQIIKQYDTVICMGNSIQFFNEDQTLHLLTTISAHMKPGGKFFINTWSLAEIVLKQFKEKGWSRFNDMLFLFESKFLLRPARVETTSIMITDNGEREEKQGVDYVFSIAEIENMLSKTGFRLKEIYSIPGKKQFIPGEPRAYLVAEKI